jgi:hypothetical protein
MIWVVFSSDGLDSENETWYTHRPWSCVQRSNFSLRPADVICIHKVQGNELPTCSVTVLYKYRCFSYWTAAFEKIGQPLIVYWWLKMWNTNLASYRTLRLIQRCVVENINCVDYLLLTSTIYSVKFPTSTFINYESWLQNFAIFKNFSRKN